MLLHLIDLLSVRAVERATSNWCAHFEYRIEYIGND